MKKSKTYKVIVYYDDRTKDIREWPETFELALSDFTRFTCLPDVIRCELQSVGRFGYDLVATFDRGAV